jgi:hypothetical protein
VQENYALEYKLSHKCGANFYPDKVERLPSDTGTYKHQDLLMGVCKCGQEVFAWIGVNHVGEPEKYFNINHTKHDDWLKRVKTEAVRPIKQNLNPLKYAREEMWTVSGSVRDKHSGRFLYRNNIPIRAS